MRTIDLQIKLAPGRGTAVFPSNGSAISRASRRTTRVQQSLTRSCLLAVAAGALAMNLAACSAAGQSADAAAPSAAASAGASIAAPAADNPRLDALWRARRADARAGDFTLGPGDVLQVSVPAIDSLKNRAVRVAGDDTIALPLIGTIDVKGMTEQDVRAALRQRLEKYMYDPQVDVFAKKYESRQVAVVGMVQKPGLYTLTSPDDTVLSMISRAGGTTETAAQRILLIPAPPGADPRTSALLAAATGASTVAAVHADGVGARGAAAAGGEAAAGRSVAVRAVQGASVPASYQPAAAALPPMLAHSEPIVINLTNAAGEAHLDIPARPGDVIVVPAAGEVMVKGWVQNPGAFKITPNMTVLGAVTAAGGEMFSSAGEVLRTSAAGGRIEIPFDLSAIQKGASPDVPVQAGDVVIVNRSVTGAVPYALYTLLTKFGTGIYPAIPF
jgi:protein involved in polysaccharide export with SLBB domain